MIHVASDEVALEESTEFHYDLLTDREEMVDRLNQWILSNRADYGLEWDKCHIGPRILDYSKILAESDSEWTDTVSRFVDNFNSLDQRDNIKFRVGDSISVLNLGIIPKTDYVAELFGWTAPKKIVDVIKQDNKILQLEFEDGDKYPKQPLAKYDGYDLLDNTIFFDNQPDTEKALSWLILSKPDRLKLNDLTNNRLVKEGA